MPAPGAEPLSESNADSVAGDASGQAADRSLPEPSSRRRGIGLCLSGGGYRAALFHAGALRRLDELGLFHQLRTVASVSGGSLLAGLLAEQIPWPLAAPLGDDWTRRVTAPLAALTRRNVRTPALLCRLLPWNWARPSAGVEALAAAYGRVMSRRLRDLPERPAFVLCATDMAFGDNWICERGRIGAYQPGYVSPPPDHWTIARAAAASSCFPPLFNPLPVRLPAAAYRRGRAKPGPERDRAVAGLHLTDGGIYDNLAIEPVWKDHQFVLVSDGGLLFPFAEDRGLLWRLDRYAAISQNQALALRKRWLMASFQTAARAGDQSLQGTYWGIGSARERYLPGDAAGYSKDLACDVIARIRTDLDAFSDVEAAVLENHGYLLADAALGKHIPALLPNPVPPLRIPHPDWMDEDRVRAALQGSDERKLLGRWR